MAEQKFANPAPLGLAGFGLTTIVLSIINAGWLPQTDVPVVIPLAFAYGGLGQLLAGFMEFRNGNTFGTVAFSSYGLFWWWFAFLNWTVGAGWIKAPAATGVGITLFMWGVFTLYMWIATFRMNFGLWTVFLLLWVTFFLLAGGSFGLGTDVIGGVVGVLTGVAALYVSFAGVMNGTFGRVVLPVGGPLVKAGAEA
jgi:succinate-acetate transporter protein